MGFEKRYPNAKDNRKRMHRYYKSKRFDATCRPGGSCDWCRGNRSHSTDKRKAAANERLRGDL